MNVVMTTSKLLMNTGSIMLQKKSGYQKTGSHSDIITIMVKTAP
jgi:hypothetical protein